MSLYNSLITKLRASSLILNEQYNHTFPIILVFQVLNTFAKFLRVHPPPYVALNTGGVDKFRDF